MLFVAGKKSPRESGINAFEKPGGAASGIRGDMTAWF
jgi:hypothetical protein